MPTNPALFERLIQLEARKRGVDPRLAVAVARQESAMEPNAVGDGGRSLGLFQLGDKAAIDAGIDPAQRQEPVKNIQGGVAYLAQALARADGDMARGLDYYNKGPGLKGGDPQYVRNVLRHYDGEPPASGSLLTRAARTVTGVLTPGAAEAAEPVPAASQEALRARLEAVQARRRALAASPATPEQPVSPVAPVPAEETLPPRTPGIERISVDITPAAPDTPDAPGDQTALGDAVVDWLPGFEFLGALPDAAQRKVVAAVPGLAKTAASVAVQSGIGVAGTVGGSAVGMPVAGAVLGSYGGRRAAQALGLEPGEPTVLPNPDDLGDTLSIVAPLAPVARHALSPQNLRQTAPWTRTAARALEEADTATAARVAQADTSYAAKLARAQELFAQRQARHGERLNTTQYRHAADVRGVAEENAARQAQYQARVAQAEAEARAATQEMRAALRTKHDATIKAAVAKEADARRVYQQEAEAYRQAVASQGDAVTNLQAVPKQYGSEQLPVVKEALALPPVERTTGGTARTVADPWRLPNGTLRQTLKETPASELELQEFIKQQGGIKLTGKELAEDFAGIIQPRQGDVYGLLNNKTGQTPAAMAELAEQHGFLAEANVSELLDALRDSTAPNGGKVYSRFSAFDPFAPAGQVVGAVKPLPPNASPAQQLYHRVETEFGDVPIPTASIKEALPVLRDRLGEAPNLEPSGVGTILKQLEGLGETIPLNQAHTFLKNLAPYLRSSQGNTRYVAGQAQELLQDAFEQTLAQADDAAAGVGLLRAARVAYRREKAVETLSDALGRGGPIIARDAQGREVVNVKQAMNLVDRLSRRDRFFQGSFTADELERLHTDLSTAARGAVPIPRTAPQPLAPTPLPPLPDVPPAVAPKLVPEPDLVAMKELIPTAPAAPQFTPPLRAPVVPVEPTLTKPPASTLLRDLVYGAVTGGAISQRPGSVLLGAGVGAGLYTMQRVKHALASALLQPGQRAALRALMNERGEVTVEALIRALGIGSGVAAGVARTIPPTQAPEAPRTPLR